MFALITEQIDWLTALHLEHSALLADVWLLLVGEPLQQTEVFEVPQRRMVTSRKTAIARVVLPPLGAERLQQLACQGFRGLFRRQLSQRADHQRHLTQVLTAEAAHQQMHPHFKANAKR